MYSGLIEARWRVRSRRRTRGGGTLGATELRYLHSTWVWPRWENSEISMHLVSKLPGCSLAGGPTVVGDLTLGTPGQVGRL